MDNRQNASFVIGLKIGSQVNVISLPNRVHISERNHTLFADFGNETCTRIPSSSDV
jgi:hypothetical protein